MSDLLASLIVPALLIAVNPVPVLVAVTLLMSERGRRNEGVFVATLAAVMLADGLLTFFLLGHGGSSAQQSAVTGKAALQTAFGMGFLAIAAAQWRSDPTKTDTPGWMRLMDKAGLGAAVVLGVSLTNYALLTAGTSKILDSHLTSTQEVAGLLFFVIVALSTVIAPLVLYLVRHAWAEAQLGRLKGWLTLHNRALLIAVFGAMGLLFTAQGLDNLLH
jgi:Sap, sulfolipid-1-addressing protein